MMTPNVSCRTFFLNRMFSSEISEPVFPSTKSPTIGSREYHFVGPVLEMETVNPSIDPDCELGKLPPY